jgi:hypothetical protein
MHFRRALSITEWGLLCYNPSKTRPLPKCYAPATSTLRPPSAAER